MDSQTTVAIVGIVTAGVVGPSVAAGFSLGLARRQHRHERQIADLAELRQVIDEAGSSLALSQSALTQAAALNAHFEDFDSRGELGAVLPSFVDDYARHHREYREYVQQVIAGHERLAIRLGRLHPVTMGYASSLAALLDVADRVAADTHNSESLATAFVALGDSLKDYQEQAQLLVASKLPAA